MQSTMTVPSTSEAPEGTPRNLQVEAKFAEWRLPFELVEEYPLDDVKIDAEAQVRAGVNIAPRERVDEYAEQWRNGAKFPPIVLNERGFVLDGNTRRAAAVRCKRTTIPAYVVTCGTPEMATMLAASLNQMGGERLTPAEAAEAAQVMMRQGFPDAAIARELGRDPSRVRRWKLQQEARERAEKAGLNAAALPKVALEKLANVRREEPFREAASLVLDAAMKPADVQALVEEVNQAASDEAAVRKIAERRADLAPAGPPPHRPNVRKEVQVARMAIGNLLKYAAADPRDLIASPADRERWEQIAKLAADVLAAAEPIAA